MSHVTVSGVWGGAREKVSHVTVCEAWVGKERGVTSKGF